MSKERDPSGRSSKEKGAKLDFGKPEILTLAFGYFPNALAHVARVSHKGALKYSAYGWQTVPQGIARYTDGLGRHLAKEFMGEEYDDEYDAEGNQIGTEELHAAQVAWNALARLELILAKKEGRDIAEPPEWATEKYD